MNHQITDGGQTNCGHAGMVPFTLRHRATSPPDRLRGPEPSGAGVVTLWGNCPWTAQLSDYDRRNIDIYARLLHDESEGASEDDLVRGVFGLDPYRNRDRALGVLRSHLRRARWIADALFPMLGW